MSPWVTAAARASDSGSVDFDFSVRIATAPAAVFDLLVDVQEYAAEPVLSMVKDPPGATAVGTRWREEIRLAPMVRMVVWSEVTELDPGRCLSMVFHQRGFSGRLTYTVQADRDGSILRQQESLQLRWLLRPLAGVVERALRSRLEERLDDIRRLLEAR